MSLRRHLPSRTRHCRHKFLTAAKPSLPTYQQIDMLAERTDGWLKLPDGISHGVHAVDSVLRTKTLFFYAPRAIINRILEAIPKATTEAAAPQNAEDWLHQKHLRPFSDHLYFILMGDGSCVHSHDPHARRAGFAIIQDMSRSEDQRLQAIQSLPVIRKEKSSQFLHLRQVTKRKHRIKGEHLTKTSFFA